MLAILDYKAGNPTSVLRALLSLGIPASITEDHAFIQASEGIIFPGVGAAGQAMNQLTRTGMDDILRAMVRMDKPVLGVCLGCQILLDFSEENDTKTLGILPGVCRRFPENILENGEVYSDDPSQGQAIRVPHMGWNSLKLHQKSPLLHGITEDDQFYFVHSYYAQPAPELVIASCHYGIDFAAIYGRDNLWAAQFHPEKSGLPGLKILENFYGHCRSHNVHSVWDKIPTVAPEAVC